MYKSGCSWPRLSKAEAYPSLAQPYRHFPISSPSPTWAISGRLIPATWTYQAWACPFSQLGQAGLSITCWAFNNLLAQISHYITISITWSDRALNLNPSSTQLLNGPKSCIHTRPESGLRSKPSQKQLGLGWPGSWKPLCIRWYLLWRSLPNGNDHIQHSWDSGIIGELAWLECFVIDPNIVFGWDGVRILYMWWRRELWYHGLDSLCQNLVEGLFPRMARVLGDHPHVMFACPTKYKPSFLF